MLDFVTLLSPDVADLHGVLEADLTRQPVGEHRGLRHHQPNQIVDKQVGPDLFDDHGGSQSCN